jgi:hypothetical protein
MSIKRIAAVTMTVTFLAAPLMAASQQTGVLGGKATDKAKAPYSNYSVRLRNVKSPAIIKSVPLDAQGTFSLTSLPLAENYLVELFSTKDNKVVCTEGPFNLSASMMTKTDINIDCGKNPTAWLIAAGAGAAVIAATTQSTKQ